MLIALVVVVFAFNAGRWASERGDEREMEVSPLLPNSVAVLPFENLSPDPGDASLVLGIQQEIIRQLGKIEDLTVIPWSAVRRYAGAQTPVSQIAAELRVEAILQGSIRYADDGLEVVPELIDGKTGALLWTEMYAGNLLATFDVQSNLTSAIANELGARLLPAERQSIETRLTENPAAYELYLRAEDARVQQSSEES